MNEIFARRFTELEKALAALPYKTSGNERYVPEGLWQKWTTSVQNLLLAVYGEQSPHYVNFSKAFEKCVGYEYEIDALKGIFLSAKEDFDGGYVFMLTLEFREKYSVNS